MIASKHDDSDGDSDTPAHHHGDRHRPSRPCPLRAFDCVRLLGIGASLRLLASQIVPLLLAPPSTWTFFQVALQTYISLFSILILLNELELPIRFFRKSPLLQRYFPRGLLYSFVGLVAQNVAASAEVQEALAHDRDQYYLGYVPWIPVLTELTGIAMIALGCLYVLMGLLCLQSVRDRLKEDHQRRLREFHEQQQQQEQEPRAWC